MNVLVISPFPAGDQRAFAINTAKMANGFVQSGHRVRLVTFAPVIKTEKKELRRRYHVSGDLEWVFLPVSVFRKKISKNADFSWLSLTAMTGFLPDYVYTRSYHAPWFYARLGFKVCGEVHAHEGFRDPHFLQLMKQHGLFQNLHISTISPVLKSYYEECGAEASRVHVLPDAYDHQHFENEPEASAVERKRPVALYSGHLYDYKGIPDVLAAAALLPEVDFVFVGGTKEDIERHVKTMQERSLTNVRFVGHVPHADVPGWLKRADVLLLPPSANHPSARWTSPVKLAEYMASGKPIVSSDIPALKYWLTVEEVAFFKADDPRSLAASVQHVLNRPEEAALKANRASKKVQEWSYKNRASSIISISFEPNMS